jgi:hypothetical protein
VPLAEYDGKPQIGQGLSARTATKGTGFLYDIE